MSPMLKVAIGILILGVLLSVGTIYIEAIYDVSRRNKGSKTKK